MTASWKELQKPDFMLLRWAVEKILKFFKLEKERLSLNILKIG